MEWLLAARASGRPVGLPELAQLHASICQATHKLVRAQMTYFRRVGGRTLNGRRVERGGRGVRVAVTCPSCALALARDDPMYLWLDVEGRTAEEVRRGGVRGRLKTQGSASQQRRAECTLRGF
jgi:hypothetical protein